MSMRRRTSSATTKRYATREDGNGTPSFKRKSKDMATPGNNLARRQNERQTAMATNIAREAALAFHEADANQDGCLNFTEFKRAIHFLRDKEGRTGYIPQKEEAELRELFDSLDADGSGDISMDEYFLFTLDLAGQQGCGLEALFKKYDTTGEGVLDANELGLAIEDLVIAMRCDCDVIAM